MKLKIAAGTLLLAIGIAGAAANDGTSIVGVVEPLGSPVPCFESVSGDLVCDDDLFIDTLPGTGSGETAGR